MRMIDLLIVNKVIKEESQPQASYLSQFLPLKNITFIPANFDKEVLNLLFLLGRNEKYVCRFIVLEKNIR